MWIPAFAGMTFSASISCSETYVIGGKHLAEFRPPQPRFSVIPAKAGIQSVPMSREYFVYILASRRNGTLYVGVTSDLVKRVWEHKNKVVKGFTEKYGVNRLVCYEIFQSAEEAITREKQLKKWLRAWKIRLIEEQNPNWKDLYDSICF